MGLEENGDCKLPGHKRSKSFPEKIRVMDGLDDSIEEPPRLKLDTGKLKGCIKTKTQNSLKQEIMNLENRLQEQFTVRRTLEKTLGSGSSYFREVNEPSSVSKRATELIKEIAVLEMEVVYLEQYLLTLYRKAFDQQISPNSKDLKSNKSPKNPSLIRRRLFVDEVETESKAENSAVQLSDKTISNRWKESDEYVFGGTKVDSSVERCHSTLSNRATLATKQSPDSVSKALRACHSQPLSMSEFAASNLISLAEHLGTRISDHIPETPNRISEEMVKCMAAIFSKLGESTSSNIGLSSPNSSYESSPHYQRDSWSPSLDTRLDNPFNVEGLKEFSGPYSTMVEVPCLYRETQKLGDVEYMLQNFKSLISQLQEVNPSKMNNEEKLAFWINVHNTLVMHAYLAYGIPQNNVKRVFLLLKAAYNIGGHTISADTIQSSILGCRMSRPGQWLRVLLSPRTKFKSRDNRQTYTIEHPEPLLHFALCSGSHSDPALRMYTPKRVVQELEGAKEEYIRATFGVRKDQKLALPKLVDSYAKDLGLSPTGIVEMIHQSLPDSLRKTLKKCKSEKSRKNIEWMPHNFAFRYLISKELVVK